MIRLFRVAPHAAPSSDEYRDRMTRCHPPFPKGARVTKAPTLMLGPSVCDPDPTSMNGPSDTAEQVIDRRIQIHCEFKSLVFKPYPKHVVLYVLGSRWRSPRWARRHASSFAPNPICCHLT